MSRANKGVKHKMQSVAVRNLKRRETFKYELIGEGIIIGIIVGAVIAAFRLMITIADSWRGRLVEYAHTGAAGAALCAFVFCLITVLTALILKFSPDVSGSGIPQVEAELKGQCDMSWYKVIIAKFTGCVLAIGGGLALGREGPSIQLGAAVGKGFSKLTGRLLTEERMLITCGAGAGLSAAFGAPLAGAIFSLEELHKNFSAEVLISTMAASAFADYVVVNIVGLTPVFNFNIEHRLPLEYYWAVIILGVLLGAFGVIYNKTIGRLQALFDRLGKFVGKFIGLSGRRATSDIAHESSVVAMRRNSNTVVLIARLFAAFALSYAMVFILPDSLGSGANLVSAISAESFGIRSLVFLLLAKFIFSTISFSSGSPGGIFLPLLVLGALTGGLFCRIMGEIAGMDQKYIMSFVVIAMCGYFAAIVRAPVTGVILITEMTGEFYSFLSLVVAALISYITAAMLGGKPIYDELRQRRYGGKSDNCMERKVVITSEVYIGSQIDGSPVSELKFPPGNLIVSVLRDGAEIIPNGSTELIGGDKMDILCRSSDIGDIEDILDVKCKTVRRGK